MKARTVLQDAWNYITDLYAVYPVYFKIGALVVVAFVLGAWLF